jgi:hypothetical protein
MFVDLAQVHVITALAARLDFRCVKISLACFEPTHILHDAEGQTFAPQYDHLEQPAMVNFDDGKRCEGLVTEQAKTLRTYGMVVFGQPSANSRFVPVISSRPRDRTPTRRRSRSPRRSWRTRSTRHCAGGPLDPGQSESVFMGVDQIGHDNRVLIASRDYDRMRLLHAGVIQEDDPWKRCLELLDQYGVRVCTVEALPNYNEAHRFAKTRDGKVFIVNYTDLVDQIVLWGDRPRDKVSIRKVDDEVRTRWSATVDQ